MKPVVSKQQPATAKKPLPPNAGKGRKAGVPNRTTTTLKEAILLAANQVGLDNTGTDGLTGYLRFIAWNEPKAFAGLLGRVLPLQITAEVQVGFVTLLASLNKQQGNGHG